MRKFIPRLFNVLIFICAFVILLPLTNIHYMLNILKDNATVGTIFTSVSNFVHTNDYVMSTKYIPIAFGAVAVFFLLIAIIDGSIKGRKGQASKPLMNAALSPLYFFGMAASLKAVYFTRTRISQNFVINDGDWFGLGAILKKIPFLSTLNLNEWIYLGIFAGLFILQLVLALGTRRLNKRPGIVKILVWIVFAILAFISFKGVTDQYINNGIMNMDTDGIISTIVFNFDDTTIFNKIIWMSLLFGSLALIVGYAVVASIRAHSNNVIMKEEAPAEIEEEKTKKVKKEKAAKEPKAENSKKNKKEEPITEEFETNVATTEEKAVEIDNPLFTLPQPEEVVETVVEEKTVIRQVIFEKANLNELFNTDYEFKNCTMVRKEAITEYFVNKQKFLSLSNNNHTLSFRLQLDKAIRLIIEYPLIGKDKYENHKIWFKIDDLSVLNKETVVNIIKEAYNTVLNNQ